MPSIIILFPKEWGGSPVTVETLIDDLAAIHARVRALESRERAIIAAIARKLRQAPGVPS
jgi:hypothetical protein